MTGHLTRRGALVALGALAGCSGANPLSSEPEPVELDAAALRGVVDDSAPSLPERLPVGIAEAHVAAGEDRARALLDAVPATLGPDEIPNGAIREEVRRAREGAATEISAAKAESTPFARLEAFGGARAEARFAAGSWRAIDEGLTREDLRGEAETVRSDRRALHDRWRYVGDDPVAATLVHAAIEDRIASGRSGVAAGEPRRYRADNPLGVGELAEEVERARVAVDDAAHIYDRLTATLDDPADLRDRLVDARRRLRDAFEAEREPLSSIDRQEPWQVEGVDVEDTPAAEALEELFRPIDPERDDGWDGTTPAEALTWAHASFVTLAAFVALRERVREGETFAVESVTDVDAVRSAAIEALRAAEASPAEPALTRHSTAELAAQLAWVDEELLNEEGSVRTSWLRNDVGTYLTVMARARATPAASERVAEALRARPSDRRERGLEAER
ncbi:hypothetical protein DU504_08850 [Haloplanus salinus]|uniref:Uncharacterized protein n=1 Tax=Haloplanus salinus TaxID=1126245 RepID=A0A368NA24_9EURY|nr:hypothetical protein [Haloplanus salinus]RCU47397.1 hypothetical protein DU504_08850 [Haloplanus salinus]